MVLRWYLSYSLSYRDIEEMMLERGIHVDHSTINRWVIHYSPLLENEFRKKFGSFEESVGDLSRILGHELKKLSTNGIILDMFRLITRVKPIGSSRVINIF